MSPRIIIRNGTIVDGTGASPFTADVLIEGECIADVAPQGLPPDMDADETIDASGRLVTPGFVDVHGHSDFPIVADPAGRSKITQGITTEVFGNCGMSAFPLQGAARADALATHSWLGLDMTWTSADEYFNVVDCLRPAFNIASFVGHGNVRASVMGMDDRPPRPDELRAMEREVEEAIEAGAVGLATGLIYAPGMFAATDEIIALQRAATRKGGIHASHVRGEGDRLLDAAAEFLDIVRSTGCQGQYSHLKASGRRNWGKVTQIIEMIERHNAVGGCVRFDKYPYTASSTELASLLPRWVRDGGRDAAADRLKDPAIRRRAANEVREDLAGFTDWQDIVIVDPACDRFRRWTGRSLADLAQGEAMDPEIAFIELLTESRLTAYIVNFSMSQDDTDAALLHPQCMVCTDGEALATDGPLAHGCPHPRAFGSFGKYLRDYVCERPLLRIEEAVRKATSLPCETFGFRRRGRVEAGHYADILVIDASRFADHSRFEDPHHYCTGLEAVIVNGTVTVRRDQLTGKRAGRVLRRDTA
ncbi:MAG: D-aminoacylase [Candidatus Sumerlaeaceae bacterium]|nr:D-aminoacylase [Candidatus Sumerlaeaceae bacterium]